MGILLVILAGAIDAMIGGWAVSVMWGWFVVPAIGVGPISIVNAIGISLIVAMLKGASAANGER